MQRISETISKQNKENELLGDSTLQRMKNKLRFDFSYESTLLLLPHLFQYKYFSKLTQCYLRSNCKEFSK